MWSAKGAGCGFSSTIIADGRIYVTGDFEAETRLVAFSLDGGKQLWSARNGDAWLNQYPGARASVTFSEGRVYQQNAHGRVACYAADTGKEIWARNVLERFRGENITWGISESLLVDERAVYVTPGGREALLVALDKRTGDLIWKTEALPEADKPAEGGAGYAPPIFVRHAGRRLIVGMAARDLFCVDADRGRIEWTRPRPTNYSVLAMAPVLVGDGIFVTAPIGPPGALYRLVSPRDATDRVGVEEGWTSRLDTAQGGVVYAEGRLYGSTYPKRGSWAAVDAMNGKVLYETDAFAKGAPLIADRRLYVLSEDGWMRLLEPTATKFEVRGEFRLATARDRDAWAHPVIHDGKLYLRYHDVVSCYDLRRDVDVQNQ